MAFSQARRLDRELLSTPGVNSYDISSGQGKTLKSNGGKFSNVFLKSIFHPRNDHPGPNSYDTEVPVEKRTTGIKFVTGKAGSSLLPADQTPGPNSYQIKPIKEYKPPRIRKLNSASLRSASRRDSEFSKKTPGPGIGKYSVAGADPFLIPKNRNRDIHTFGPEKDRFANSFQGNMAKIREVPGPGKYHPELIVKPMTAPTGGRKSKYLGKQNEIGVKPHTFGADKDRFKDSMYGRLSDIAKIPGTGSYDVGYSLDYLYKAEFMRMPSRDGRVPGSRPTTHVGNRPPTAKRVQSPQRPSTTGSVSREKKRRPKAIFE